MRSTEPELKNSETNERVFRWLAPTKIVTFVWEKGEPPECGRHPEVPNPVPTDPRTANSLRSPKGRQGIAQGFSPG